MRPRREGGASWSISLFICVCSHYPCRFSCTSPAPPFPCGPPRLPHFPQALPHESVSGFSSLDSADPRSGCASASCQTMKMVMMGATSGVKLAVLFLVLSLPLVLGQSNWRSDGHITFYGSPNGGGTQAGACGYQNTYALGYGSMTAALSSALFQGGAACGACFQLQCIRPARGKNWCYSYARSITVTATNLCPPGSTGGWCNPPRAHFDLPMPAFLTLAARQGGVAPVRFRRVACAKRGGVRFTMGGNPWFLMILIHNVGGAGDLRSVQIKGSYSGWVNMYRNWGALWTCRSKLSGALTFKLTSSDGRTLVTGGPGRNWKFGQTWEGSNFRLY